MTRRRESNCGRLASSLPDSLDPLGGVKAVVLDKFVDALTQLPRALCQAFPAERVDGIRVQVAWLHTGQFMTKVA
jgi:hypothetical protein